MQAASPRSQTSRLSSGSSKKSSGEGGTAASRHQRLSQSSRRGRSRIRQRRRRTHSHPNSGGSGRGQRAAPRRTTRRHEGSTGPSTNPPTSRRGSHASWPRGSSVRGRRPRCCTSLARRGGSGGPRAGTWDTRRAAGGAAGPAARKRRARPSNGVPHVPSPRSRVLWRPGSRGRRRRPSISNSICTPRARTATRRAHLTAMATGSTRPPTRAASGSTRSAGSWRPGSNGRRRRWSRLSPERSFGCRARGGHAHRAHAICAVATNRATPAVRNSDPRAGTPPPVPRRTCRHSRRRLRAGGGLRP
mmetsp:Transcript_23195/g.68145  ORF Transcript_23195/g.68145 Transcript_23195/m.68145 type:complete len:303 (+) Transcript_23195:114-1022(+)